MQLEPMPESGGYRVWLSDNEQEQLLDHLKEKPERQLAARAMLHGLRNDELRWVRLSQIRELDAEEEAYKLRIKDGKTGYREVPVSREMVQQMRIYKRASSTRKNKPLIDAGKRSRRRWISDAGEELAELTGNEDWRKMSPHDLRRTWATSTYYSLDTHYAVDIIMRWGGWVDRETFVNNYLGRETDTLAVEMMNQAGLR
jgi:integrase